MDLNLFNKIKSNNNFANKFIEELRDALKIKNENNTNNNVIEEYDLYEKKKVYLDNKSRKGNDLAWVMDLNSVCLSECGDGGPISINEIDLPKDVKVGEVYEKINGKYVYNSEITTEINSIKNV